MTPDSENVSSNVTVLVLNAKKNFLKKKNSSSLSGLAALPTNDIRDLLKRIEKRKEKKLKIKQIIIWLKIVPALFRLADL